MDKIQFPDGLRLHEGPYQKGRLTCYNGPPGHRGGTQDFFVLLRLDLSDFDPTVPPPPPGRGWRALPAPDYCQETGEFKRWWRVRQVSALKVYFHPTQPACRERSEVWLLEDED